MTREALPNFHRWARLFVVLWVSKMLSGYYFSIIKMFVNNVVKMHLYYGNACKHQHYQQRNVSTIIQYFLKQHPNNKHTKEYITLKRIEDRSQA
jgi:hypothetical protein